MTAPTRLISLDVFRGLTMAAMVIVNNPGDWGNVYAPLLHAPWHGWTPTDLIFPFFLFIVGVSITLSKKSSSWASIVRRAAIIFAIGLFLAGYPRFNIERWRIPGVLQRIAICYLFAAALYKSVPGLRGPAYASEFRRPGLLGPAIIAGVAGALALVYWFLIAGDLTPDGNLGARIDRALMQGHLWKPTWDPEGLLSTIPAITTTLLGVLGGLVLGSSLPASRKATWLAVGGAALMLVG